MVLLHQIGNYKCTGVLLGKGNFARVEEAVHKILKIEVALKIIQIDHDHDQDANHKQYIMKNLYREANLLSKLSHPCIVSLFETLQCKNCYILVLESVYGGDLATYLREQKYGRLSEKSTWFFAVQLISAVSHMHSKNIIHRDLKMENILLNSTKTRIKIVDFGLSNEYSPKHRLRTFCGSPEYAAPELFTNEKKYGSEVDMWSLGVILYALLIGKLPFRIRRKASVIENSKAEFIQRVQQGLLDSGHQRLLLKMSIDVKDVLLKLINPNPEKRIKISSLKQHKWVTRNGRFIIKTNPFAKFYDQCKVQALNSMTKLLSNSEIVDNNDGLFRIILQYKLMRTVETNIVTCTCYCCCCKENYDINRLIAPVTASIINQCKHNRSDFDCRLKHSKLKPRKTLFQLKR